jgi:competence protein ComEA
MRRTVLLISLGGALLLGAVAWLAAEQRTGRQAGPRAAETTDAAAGVNIRSKVDLNQAGLEELTKLPGITPVLAQRIVQHRPYRKLDDLVSRKVLGKKQFARIREFVVVNSRAP